MKIPLAHQIAEVKREIALRNNVYSSLVARGKMRQSESDLHMARIRAVLETLEWLEEHAAEVKELARAEIKQLAREA